MVRVLGSPGPATLAAINQRLEEVLELMLEDGDAKAPFIAFTWTLTPVRTKPAVGRKGAGRKGTRRARGS